MNNIVKKTQQVSINNREQRDLNVNNDMNNYRELYFQAMQKLTQMSTISNLLQGTLSTCNRIEISNIISEHQKNIFILQQESKSKDQKYGLLEVKLKSQQCSFNQRQKCFKQKLQVQIRKKNLTLDQLDLIKTQLKLCKKQLDIVQQQNHKLKQQLVIKRQSKSKQVDNLSQELILNGGFKLLVKDLQNEVYQLQLQNLHLKSFNEQSVKQINKLQQQIISIQQLHKLENLSKTQFIQNLQRDLKLKQQKMNNLLTKDQQNNKLSVSNNNIHIKSYQQLQNSLNDKSKVIERLQIKISQYEQLIKSYEQKEQQIYMQLIKKDIQIQESQGIRKQLLNKINLLQSLITDLKSSYITTQLKKDQCAENYKKSLKVLRISNLQLGKLNQTQNTACETLTLTPSSSLSSSQLKINSNDLNSSLPNDPKSKKSCLTAKNKFNQIKSSFYKNKTSKTLNRKYSQIITPFEI